MKRSQFVSSSRRKSRKAHFGAPSHERRKLMAAPLSKELRQKFGVRSMPIRKDDEVVIRRGGHKSNDPQKVVTVRRRKFVIHLAGLNTEKSNGSSVAVGVHPSNVEIVKLKLDKDRKRAIDRKSKFRFTQADKNKVQQQDIPVQ